MAKCMPWLSHPYMGLPLDFGATCKLLGGECVKCLVDVGRAAVAAVESLLMTEEDSIPSTTHLS